MITRAGVVAICVVWLTLPCRADDRELPDDAPADFVVPEDARHGSIVGRLTATPDAAAGDFAILDGNEHGAFAIDGRGELRVDAPAALDYEARRQFALTVRYRLQRPDDAAWSSFVADLLESGVDPTTASGLLTRYETRRIRIDVADVDEPPVVRPQSLTIVVDGEPVRVTAEAGDADEELQFEILSGVPEGVLTIDASSGLLRVTMPEALPVGSSVFPLTVRVTDRAGHSDVTTANVTIVRRAPAASPDGPATVVDPAVSLAADEPIVVPMSEETAAAQVLAQNSGSEEVPIESTSPPIVRSTAGGLLRSSVGSSLNWPMLLIATAAGLIGGAIVWRLRQQARGARLEELEHLSDAPTEGAVAQRAINAAEVWADAARPIRISATEESWASTAADVQVPADLWTRVESTISDGAGPAGWTDPTLVAEPIPDEPTGTDAPGAEVPTSEDVAAVAQGDHAFGRADSLDVVGYGEPAWVQPESAIAEAGETISAAGPDDVGHEHPGEAAPQWAETWHESTTGAVDAVEAAADVQPMDGDDPAEVQPEVQPDVVEPINAILDEAGAVEAAAHIEELLHVTVHVTPDSVPVPAAPEHDPAASAVIVPAAEVSTNPESSDESPHATAGQEPASDDPRVSELRQRLSSLFGIPVGDLAAHETPAGHEPPTIESPPAGAPTVQEAESVAAEDATLARLAELRSIVARATAPAGGDTPAAPIDLPAASRSEAVQAATSAPGASDVTTNPSSAAPPGTPPVSAAAVMAAGRSSAGLNKTAMRLELSSLREVANRHARAAVAQHASRQQAQRQWIAAMAAMIVLCLLGTWMLNGGFSGVLRNAGWGLIAAGAGALVICVRAYWKLRAEGDDDFEFDAPQMVPMEREPVTRIVEDTRSAPDAEQTPAGRPLLHDELIELTQHFARSQAVEEDSVVEAGR